ncbi:response regulator transcription factor [Alteromonas pelagimontana]|uniref:Response regulator transcription factor n=1 Tax=Alteromonas pelagimontana TaxID=1858656 RepID=A0A6M4MEU3_9ALTE|nr:response regulator transcription factor [Alteromonas pelagimontana]QJR81150.1 response regulator transcription factor [Alteromonas pelagimontana]
MNKSHKFNVFLISGSFSSDTHPTNENVQLFKNLLRTCGYDVTELTSIENLPATSNQDLIFFDASQSEKKLSSFYRYQGCARWIMFNLLPGDIDECEAIIAGVEGTFYASDSPELLLKGLRRLAKMDVWFKRGSINEALRRMRQQSRKQSGVSSMRPMALSSVHPKLTKREITIIELVSKGSQNQEIADQLHISVNTVKTHIYSIFRKTQSRNRIELLSWSQDYIYELR